jgi:hypothetical protein
VLFALKLPLDVLHVTPALPTSFVTVAVKPSDCPSVNPPRFGVMLTLTGPDVPAEIVIVAAALFVASRTEVAVTITVAGVGTLLGAIYVIAVPEALVVPDKVPHVAPLQPAPLSVHVTPLFCASFATVAVKLCPCPVCTVAAVGATLTPTAVVTVIVAAHTFVPSATEVAVNVTVAGFGAPAGAVYAIGVPEALVVAESVPQVAPLHPVPLSVQLTPLFCASFVTVAVKVCVPIPACTLCVAGATATTITGVAEIVIVALALRVPSAAALALIVTVAGVGTLAGAVYVTATPDALVAADSVPHAAPVHPVPLSVQLTPLFCPSFETVAVNICVNPACTPALVGATLTEIAGVTVIAAAPDLVPSLTDVAVNVTSAGRGALAGAV